MSFLARIFGRPAGPAHPESWQVGDWAERVTMGQWIRLPEREPAAGPRHGQVMRVIGVAICRDPLVKGGSVLCLAFAGWPGEYFAATAFRKLNPRADEATAAEAEFTALVKRKPAPALTPTLPGETIEEFQ